MSFLLVALIGSAAEVTDVFAFKAVNDLKNSQDWTASKSLNMPTFNKDYKGVQIGVKNTPAGEFTLTSTKSFANVKAVNITASTGGACSISVSVGDAVFTSNGQNSVVVASGTNNAGKVYSFTGDGNGNVVITFNATSKAMYLGQIEVVYDDGAAETDVKTPTFSLKEDTYYEAQQVIIATETEGASITYSVTKNDAEFVASTTAVAPVTVELPMDAAVANYVITAKAVKDGMTESAEVSAKYTLNPNKPAARMFIMVNDASELAAGDKVIFVAQQVKDGGYQGDVAMGGFSEKYGMVEHVTVVEGDVVGHGPFKGVIHGENTMNVHVFEVGGDASGYTFQDEADQTYISSTNSNGLYWTSTVSNEEKWTLSNLTEGVTLENVAHTGRILKYNPNFPRFATYTKGQEDVLIFKHSVELSGVESNIAEEAAVINTIAGGVVVAVSEPTIASVYTVSGQLVANQEVDATATINLANGFYIVKVGNTVKKVIVR